MATRFFCCLLELGEYARKCLLIMKEEFHLGKLVHEELIRCQHSVTWLAQQINCERTNCHTIFRRKYISIELLERISIALKHNFFNDLALYEDSVLNNSTTV